MVDRKKKTKTIKPKLTKVPKNKKRKEEFRKKFGRVMSEFKKGTLYSSGGSKVVDKKQAIAIAFSVAARKIK